MKYVIALVAAFALLGFTATTARAADAAAKPKHHKGHFEKLDGKELTYKGGAKGKGAEHTIKTDDKTKVTLDGKDATLSDLKPDVYVEITDENGVATAVAASTTVPAEKGKKDAADKAGATSDKK